MGKSLQTGSRSRTERSPAGPASGNCSDGGGGGGADGAGGMDFAGVIACYQTPLLRYTGRIVGHAEDAQDVVQDTFLRYYRRVSHRGKSSVKMLSTWLFRVAHNLALDVLRKRQREGKARAAVKDRPVGEGEIATVSKMIRQAACEKAMAELQKLPENLREVLLLKIIQDMTLRDIARVTGLSFGNVAYRINQGLKEIAERLKDAGVT